ncbi:hypothetical protein NVP1029O_37 [Vibrio phage 1.029.O._10N.261.55.A7]|nr:hypothetical protein NVP1029O_37 [Vibrio phage 1.029.O._10N.261.55.A7]
MNQFKRQYLIKSGGKTIIDGTKADAPQVTFTVENVFGGGVSYAEISIYGLSRDNRELLSSRESREAAGYRDLELFAGYEGSLSVIFKGVIRNAFKNSPDGINQVVTMFCRSSGIEFENNRISKTFGESTPAIDVIKDVASGFDFPVSIYGDFSGEPVYISGLSISSDVKSALNELAVDHGFTWQIENQKTIIVKDGEVRSESAQTYDPNNLLIGGTEVTDVGANIVVKLNPSLTPYTYINIKSLSPRANYSGVYEREVNVKQGRYKILQTTHTGDFEGDTWESRAQCLR